MNSQKQLDREQEKIAKITKEQSIEKLIMLRDWLFPIELDWRYKSIDEKNEEIERKKFFNEKYLTYDITTIHNCFIEFFSMLMNFRAKELNFDIKEKLKWIVKHSMSTANYALALTPEQLKQLLNRIDKQKKKIDTYTFLIQLSVENSEKNPVKSWDLERTLDRAINRMGEGNTVHYVRIKKVKDCFEKKTIDLIRSKLDNV